MRYTRADLIEKLGMSPRGITKALDQLNSSGLFEETGRILANGRPEKQYKFDDLPNKWQKRLTDDNPAENQQISDGSSTKTSQLIKISRSTGDAGGCITQSPAPESMTVSEMSKLTGIPERTIRHKIHTKELAGTKTAHGWNVMMSSFTPEVREIIEKNRVSGCSIDINTNRQIAAVAKAEVVPRGMSVDAWIGKVARDNAISKSTLYNWIKTIRGQKLREINTETELSDAGRIALSVRTNTTSIEAIEYLAGLYIQNFRMTREALIDKTVEKAAECGWRTGSKKTLYRILAELLAQIPHAQTLVKGGTTAFTKEIAPLMTRDLLQYKSLELIVGDQHIFDFLCTDGKEVFRMECYVFVDMRSRFILGFCPTLRHYNKYTIGAALMQAFRFGVPENIYTDMGKPELSKYLANVRHNLTGISTMIDRTEGFINVEWMTEMLESEGVPISEIVQTGHHVAIGRRPNSKPIEGYFAVIERWLFDRLGGRGYCKKQDNADDNLKLTGDMNREKKNGRLLSVDEFIDAVGYVIRRWNSHEVRTDKIIPEKEFFANLKQNPRPVYDETELAFALLPEVLKTVKNSKIDITDHGQSYYSPKLAKYSGRHAQNDKVLVKYHPYDTEQVHLFDSKTKDYIGLAEPYGKINPKKAEEVASRMRDQKVLEKATREIVDYYKEKAPSLKAVSKITRQAHQAEKQKKNMKKIKEGSLSAKDAKLIFLKTKAG